MEAMPYHYQGLGRPLLLSDGGNTHPRDLESITSRLEAMQLLAVEATAIY